MTEAPFRLKYVLASCMYGTTKLAEILPEIAKTGAEALDVWPKKHGDQREQIDAMGIEAFQKLVTTHKAKVGMLTRFDLGPFRLKPEFAVAEKLGATLIVTGSPSAANLKGDALKSAIAKFCDQLRPHLEAAEERGLFIAIENHADQLLAGEDGIRWFLEASPSPHLGVALALYHLPQNAEPLARLIRDCGEKLLHFYAWQHGEGCMKPMPKEKELLQLPGRGSLDFGPILAALAAIDYRGWTEVFMHPTPRGIPILPMTAEVTTEINRSREHLERRLADSR